MRESGGDRRDQPTLHAPAVQGPPQGRGALEGDPVGEVRLHADLQTTLLGSGLTKATQASKDQDMGVLVGPGLILGYGYQPDDTLRVLLDEDARRGENILVTGPIDVLRWASDRHYPDRFQDDTVGTIGKTRQLVRLETELTPLMVELIKGLYDHESDGPARSLHHVIQAATELAQLELCESRKAG